ncbi:MAG: hypothetical protein AB7V56_07335 [Candidatus Nitrosocosmicus sp.]
MLKKPLPFTIDGKTIFISENSSENIILESPISNSARATDLPSGVIIGPLTFAPKTFLWQSIAFNPSLTIKEGVSE